MEQVQADLDLVSQKGWHSLMFAVIGGHVDVIDYLLYETAVSVPHKDVYNMSAKDLALV